MGILELWFGPTELTFPCIVSVPLTAESSIWGQWRKLTSSDNWARPRWGSQTSGRFREEQICLFTMEDWNTEGRLPSSNILGSNFHSQDLAGALLFGSGWTGHALLRKVRESIRNAITMEWWEGHCDGHEEDSWEVALDWSLMDCVSLGDWLKLPGQWGPYLSNEVVPVSSPLSVFYDHVFLSVVSSVFMDIGWFLYQLASAQKTGQFLMWHSP